MWAIIWSAVMGNLPIFGAILLLGLAIGFWPQLFEVARWVIFTPRGRVTALAVLVAGLWWRDHHLQYAAGLTAGRTAARAEVANARADEWEATAKGYVALTQRFATLSESLDERVDQAAAAAAGRVAADVSAGRLRLRPIWQVPADLLASADPGVAAQLAFDRESAAARIAGIGARADARFAECLALLDAERAAYPGPVTPPRR